MLRPAALAFVSLTLLAVPLRARANCAAPVTYRSTVTDRTVSICPENFGARSCPDEGLLRRNSQSGEAVVVTDCDAAKCFVDECVPPGTYQYGFVNPYECHRSSCGTYYFVDVTVSAPDGACTRSAGRNAPAAFTGTVPWGSKAQICGYGAGPSCASTGGPSAVVFSVNGLALLLGIVLLRRRRRAP